VKKKSIMRKILFLLAITSLTLLGNLSSILAQTVYTTATLTPEYKAIISKVTTEQQSNYRMQPHRCTKSEVFS